jgi:hypothetical protein
MKVVLFRRSFMPLKYVLIPAGKPRDINIGTNFSAACYIPWCLLYGTSQIHNSPLEQYVNEFLLNGQCHAPYNLQQFLMNSIFYYHILCFNMFVFACPIIARSQCWLFANIRIGPHISVLALKHPYLPPNLTSGICAVVLKKICQSTRKDGA